MKQVIALAFALFLNGQLFAQHTFSIVAVDPQTGEVGGAGASCVVGAGGIGGVVIINGILPGRGAINAQAWVCIPNINLDNAIEKMEEGLSPQEIIGWLQENDACGAQDFDPAFRQYGIVDLDTDGTPRSAAFTGSSADDWKGHRTGDTYAIQGNILMGPEVLDSMEARFLATEGPLAFRLMAAMQGANMVGADSRCTAAGTSSTSAFLRVFRPEDTPDAPYLELNVAETPSGVEPIDSLQALFDAWVLTPAAEREVSPSDFRAFPNPAHGQALLDYSGQEALTGYRLLLYSLQGQLLQEQVLAADRTTINLPPQKGVYLLRVLDGNGEIVYSQKITGF